MEKCAKGCVKESIMSKREDEENLLLFTLHEQCIFAIALISNQSR